MKVANHDSYKALIQANLEEPQADTCEKQQLSFDMILDVYYPSAAHCLLTLHAEACYN